MSSGPRALEFIGRQHEMATLTTALDDGLSGLGRLVMVAGEPGIGKTRIAQELADLAERRGARVLWGLCYEREGAPPYWPWIQTIRDYIKAVDPDKVRLQMGLGAGDIAEVIAEVRQALPEVVQPPVLEPDQARFRLFDSITTFFKAAAQDQPLVVILDDLHWGDNPSLLLLEFLANQIAESQILIVGTYRDSEVHREHPLSEAIARLYRTPNFYSTILTGLDSKDVGPFILATSGSKASKQLIDAVFNHTEGNPFFMSEVIRLLGERGAIDNESDTAAPLALQMPRGVFEVVRQRLNLLSEECRQILSDASLIGRDFDLRLLRMLSSDSKEDQLLELVEEAISAHLIQEREGAVDRYQFSHAVVQQTLAEELTNSRTVRLHARIAEALETIYGALSDHVEELAHHFTQAAPLLGLEKMVKYVTLAGEHALITHAYDDALGYFQRGLAAKEVDLDNKSGPIDGEAAALLFGLGKAQLASRHRRDAISNISRAFDYYSSMRDVTRAVAIAEYPFSPGIGRVRVTPLIARALDLVDADSRDAGRLLARYGLALSSEIGDHAAAKDAFDRSLAIARAEGDAEMETQSLIAAAQDDLFNVRMDDGLSKCDRAIDLARRSGNQLAEAQSRLFAGYILICQGKPEESDYHARNCLNLAETIRDQTLLSGALFINMSVQAYLGNSDKVRQFANRGLGVSPTDPRSLALLAGLEFETGNFEKGNAHLLRLVEAARSGSPGPTFENVMLAVTAPAAARAMGSSEFLELGQEAGEAVTASPFAIPMFQYWARTGLAMTAMLRKDKEASGQLYAALEPYQNFCGASLGSVSSVLGSLAVLLGRLDQAIEHFEVASNNSWSYLYTGWNFVYYADALLQRDKPGDKAKAIELLERTLAEANKLGMPPLATRVSELLESATKMQPSLSGYRGGLTQRQMEVLTLLAQGKTNLEIAQALVLSERTVHRHISNLYTKINVRNRAEATTYALSQIVSTE